MNDFQATAVMVALFALRCVLPMVLMLAIGYGMNKLVDHWEREEAAAKNPPPAIPLPVASFSKAAMVTGCSMVTVLLLILMPILGESVLPGVVTVPPGNGLGPLPPPDRKSVV